MAEVAEEVVVSEQSLDSLLQRVFRLMSHTKVVQNHARNLMSGTEFEVFTF